MSPNCVAPWLGKRLGKSGSRFCYTEQVSSGVSAGSGSIELRRGRTHFVKLDGLLDEFLLLWLLLVLTRESFLLDKKGVRHVDFFVTRKAINGRLVFQRVVGFGGDSSAG